MSKFLVENDSGGAVIKFLRRIFSEKLMTSANWSGQLRTKSGGEKKTNRLRNTTICNLVASKYKIDISRYTPLKFDYSNTDRVTCNI